MVKAIWAVACSVLVVLNLAAPLALPVFAQEAAGVVAPARNAPMPTGNSINTLSAPLTSQRVIMDNSAKIRRPIQTRRVHSPIFLSPGARGPASDLGLGQQGTDPGPRRAARRQDLHAPPAGCACRRVDRRPTRREHPGRFVGIHRESRSHRDRASGQRAEILHYRICGASRERTPCAATPRFSRPLRWRAD